jgi:S-DNA-T family DNA segregation ATPase FtsK/SpoIIIE
MENINYFNNILQSFKIKAECVDYNKSDTFSYYDLRLFPKAKVADLQRYNNEISLALKSPCKPSVKIIHNLGVVRLEFIHPRETPLRLFNYFTNDNVPSGDLICLLGETVDGKQMWMDLAKNPHMIVSGTTGSGKSTLLHNIIANIYNYSNSRLFLIDPKNIEFALYDKHMGHNTKVVYSYESALTIMQMLLMQMEYRYELLRHGDSLNEMQDIVLIIDEFADLIMQDVDATFYKYLCTLAQKCRAAKIYIIIGTQRPSVNIINGTIKANFAARIACRVASHVDSKVILDASGAENLMGNGDALLRDNSRFSERFQVAYTDAEEVCSYFGK